MKLFLKSLKGDKQEVEADLQDTVLALKERIKQLQGCDPAFQKLISAGQIMEDSKQLCDYSLKENDSLVLMVSKPKPQARVIEAPSVPDPSPEPQALPSDSEGRVRRAVELLRTGLQVEEVDDPEDFDDMQDDEYADPLEDQLQLMLADPAMQQLRQDILADPRILNSIAEGMRSSNPAIAQLLADHPDEIVAYLRQEEAGVGSEGELIRAQPRRVEVSTEEMEAIRNLASLGYSEEDALEAYLSCDKDAAMAANLLIETYTPLSSQRRSQH